jgi:glycosyltransferase involved in cell wall biosynthesis
MLADQFKLAIVMPVFNNMAYTKNAVQSLRKNTHNNFLLIIVDDASTDQTPLYLKSICGPSEHPGVLCHRRGTSVKITAFILRKAKIGIST